MKLILGDSKIYHSDILIQEIRTENDSGSYKTSKLFIALDNVEPVPEFDVEATTEYLNHVLEDLDLEIDRCVHDKMHDVGVELMPIRRGLEVVINMLKVGLPITPTPEEQNYINHDISSVKEAFDFIKKGDNNYDTRN